MPNEISTMSVTEFNPEFSTDVICVGEDYSQCLTDTIEALESHTHTAADVGAAASGHTHTPASIGAAPLSHSHGEYSETTHNHDSEYAEIDHAHTDYAEVGHTHTGFANATHSHAISEITDLTSSLANKANASHTHAQSEITDLTSSLSGKADLVDGKVPTSQLPSYVSDIVEETNLAAFPTTGASNTIYVAQDTNKSYRWSGSAYVELSQSIALGETSATAYRGDRGKIAYDHSQDGTVHVTAAQKTAWDAKAEATHAHASDYIAKALQFTADNGAIEKTFYVADETNLITELEGLSLGFHTVYSQAAVEGNPNTTESFRCVLHKTSSNIMWVLAFGTSGSVYSNYWNGGTWRGWKQIYTTGDKPTAEDVGAIAKSLQFTADNGNVEYSFGADSGKNILTEINGWGIGLHTAYAAIGTAGNPNTADAFRYLVHKTSANIGWILAFGGHGSVYANYDQNGTFRGWRCLYDTENAPLWTGGWFMNAGHTITPSKKLSECRNGWMLEWSDYDADTSTANNYNIVQTPIYKRNVAGNWSGQNMMVSVPTYIDTNGGTVTHALKQLVVHDDKIVGHALNSTGSINIDVVLRAVYEW